MEEVLLKHVSVALQQLSLLICPYWSTRVKVFPDHVRHLAT